ncbi:hypothetical protein BDZ91DRAFT_489925 [Kalaharituber pfeilii]|nr:hypothetical protein BDZ91DRAFT_489925 [Kalaharituber pfeilii]
MASSSARAGEDYSSTTPLPSTPSSGSLAPNPLPAPPSTAPSAPPPPSTTPPTSTSDSQNRALLPDTTLTSHDRTILHLLFDPESTPTHLHSPQTESQHRTPPPPPSSSSNNADTVPSSAHNTSLHAISLAESALSKDNKDDKLSLLTASLNTLTTLTSQYPHFASAWNNRAQVLRLLLDLDPPIATNAATTPQWLTSQIRLSLQHTLSLTPTPPPTPHDRHLLQSAWTQLGALYLHFSKHPEHLPVDAGPDTDPSALESKASHAFEQAGKLGSELGKAMAVRTNPYAKMCAGMVREVMRREMQGEA